jgi:hypothetical protein
VNRRALHIYRSLARRDYVVVTDCTFNTFCFHLNYIYNSSRHILRDFQPEYELNMGPWHLAAFRDQNACGLAVRPPHISTAAAILCNTIPLLYYRSHPFLFNPSLCSTYLQSPYYYSYRHPLSDIAKFRYLWKQQ